jgi:hypothetical protein
MLSLLLAITQDDVFKSISQNVSGEGDSGEGGGKIFLAVILGAVAIILLLSLLSLRRKREAVPKAINHPGKLLKEMLKQIPLKPSELRQLKVLTEAEKQADSPIQSPLVFILCPSALAHAIRSPKVKVDRKVLAGLARKMGLVTASKK